MAVAFSIREANKRDLERVIWINRTVLPENYPSFYFNIHLNNFPKAFLVAEIGDKIVGYIMCRVEQGELLTKPGVIGRKGHIVSLAVLPEARRKGIGTTLINKALDAMYREYRADEYYLEVRVSNTPAINLYKKLNFKIIRIIPGYYLDGEDAYLMARSAP